MWTAEPDHVGMAKKTVADPRISRARERKAAKAIGASVATPLADADDEPDLFLGQWLDRLKLKQSEIADKVGITRAYMNNLCNPPKGQKRKNPSISVMLRISKATGVSVNDLYSPPPSRAESLRLRQYQASTIDALRAAGVIS
jgi:transcriptional regulator with XRE-family HTH domain